MFNLYIYEYIIEEKLQIQAANTVFIFHLDTTFFKITKSKSVSILPLYVLYLSIKKNESKGSFLFIKK